MRYRTLSNSYKTVFLAKIFFLAAVNYFLKKMFDIILNIPSIFLMIFATILSDCLQQTYQIFKTAI